MKKHLWRYAMIVPLICFAVFSISGRIYLDTDNITIAVVANGLYGNNNFCQHIHPLLCIIVKLLDRLIPSADMYTFLIHALVFLTIYILAYITLDYAFEKPLKKWDGFRFVSITAIMLGIAFVSTSLNLWNVNYTVQTVTFMSAGLIVLVYAIRKKYRGVCKYAGMLLVCVSCLLRVKGVLLSIPYFLLEILTELFMAKDIKHESKTLIKTFGCCVIVIAVLLFGQSVFNSVEPYKTAVKHNHFRELVVDFPVREYDAADPLFKDIRRAEYEGAWKWILADTDVMTAANLEKFANAGATNASLSSFSELLKEMFEEAFTQDIQLISLNIITGIIFLWEMLCLKNRWLRMEAVLAIAGSFVILGYFTFRGRALVRIWQSVLILADGVLISVLLKNRLTKENKIESGEKTIEESINGIKHTRAQEGASKGKTRDTIIILTLCTVFWFSIGQYIATAEIHSPGTTLTAKIGADDSAYEKTFTTEDGRDDAVYLWPWWHMTIPEYFSAINKLPTERVIRHNIAIGDWTYGQPYFTEFLSSINCSNPLRALLDRPNTYLVAGIQNDIIEYYKLEYGEFVVLEEVGKIDGWTVFEVKKGK